MFAFSSSHSWGEDPWIEPQDTTMAMNDPDRYAWRLFVALNWPSVSNSCQPDQTKKIGDEGRVVWESWASKLDIFLPKAKKPEAWEDLCKKTSDSQKILQPSAQLKAVALSDTPKQFKNALELLFERPDGPFSTAADEEVRMNREAFDFIRDNKLYSLTEQERLAAAGVKTLVFPLKAKEIKAHWVIIDEAEKPRYHWTEVTENGTTKVYGLCALHIITRDMPRWFWSTFEHVDNETKWATIHPEGFRGWSEVKSSDSTACPPDQLDCNKIPSGFGLENTKWQFFRLRGTQTDWVDHRGNPTVLVNSKIEGGFDQKTMSCITCHALAVKGTTGRSMPIQIIPGTLNSEGRPHGYIGPIDPKLFLDATGNPVQYIGLDFVWSLRNAQREEP